MYISNKFNLKESLKRCLNTRRKILDISQTVTALHAAGAFSCVEIVDSIYYGLLRKDDKNNFIDTFLMSKGHGCMTQYVVLEKLKILSSEYLDTYCKPNGKLGCHPDYGIPGIEASTGSLGHGMALATGMCHADNCNSIDRNCYVVLSDGELQEGSTWEAMMMAANLDIKNLVVLLDHNGSQSFGHTRETHPKFYPIKDKVESFQWEVDEVNGHETSKIINSVNKRNKRKPFFLICNTVKGRGVSFMENKPIWHYRSPNQEEYKQAIRELEEIHS